jgi:hypothetical protein
VKKALLFGLYRFRKSSGSFAMFAAIRCERAGAFMLSL